MWLRPLADALPGVRPEQLSRFSPPPGGGRSSAVLVLFAEGPTGPDVLLIERAATLRSHAGQPAFPGGALDPEDGPVDEGGHVRGALREAVEEVGLDPATVEVVGVLPALWLPPSGFVVHPVVAWWRDPHEAELVDPANRVQVTHPSGVVGPAFEVRGLLVWGFTAGLLSRVLEIAGWARPWDTSRRRRLDPQTLALALRSSPANRAGAPTSEEDLAVTDAEVDAEATGAG